MKTVEIKSPVWVGDTVYGITASPAGEKNKVNYLVKSMKVVKVHYLPDAKCQIAFTVREDESEVEHFNTSEALTDSKDCAEEIKKEWEEKLPEWRDEWMKSFKKYDVLMGGLERFLKDGAEHTVEVGDDVTTFIVSLDEDGNEVVRDAESEYLDDEE